MKRIKYGFVFVALFVFTGCNKTSNIRVEGEASTDQQFDKQLVIPEEIWKVPNDNNFNDPDSKYSFSRLMESQDIALFWDKGYGEEPWENVHFERQFYPDSILANTGKLYKLFLNELAFLGDEKSSLDSTKILMFVFDEDDGTAYGGGAENIGIFWAPSTRVNQYPYAAIAHELGHAFQYLVAQNGGWGFQDGGPIWEMTAQWMLWQAYPDWITFENYHLEGFLTKTHLAFLHEANMYHSPFVLEYWSDKHGLQFIGKLWRESLKGEDPVDTYKRLTKIDQETFNDEIFDAARKFVTWDLNRIREVSKQYRNQHVTLLQEESGWLVNNLTPPQNYGYNAIELKVPESADTIEIEFKGLVEENDPEFFNSSFAGWRYGLLAYKKDGTVTYGTIHKEANNILHFEIPNDTQNLWLVVSGAPKKHWGRHENRIKEQQEKWPYKIKISGTNLKK